jgi:hypothetical protein
MAMYGRITELSSSLGSHCRSSISCTVSERVSLVPVKRPVHQALNPKKYDSALDDYDMKLFQLCLEVTKQKFRCRLYYKLILAM